MRQPCSWNARTSIGWYVLAEDQQTPVGVVSTTDIVRAMLGESDSDDDDD